MQNTNLPLPLTDEPNLIDFLHVLVKHKVLVLSTPAAMLLLATVYLLITPSIFESQAVIHVGQVGLVGLVEAPATLQMRLRNQYRLDDQDAITDMPKLTDISIDKKYPNAITFRVQGNTSEGAKKYLDGVVKNLLAEHSNIYSQIMNVYRQRLQSMGDQILALKEYTQKLTAHIEVVGKDDPSQAAILAIEKDKILTEVPNLEREYTALQLALSDFQSQPTRLLRGPTLPSKTQPQPKFVLALATLLGSILGIFFAFIVEFSVKVQQQWRQQAV